MNSDLYYTLRPFVPRWAQIAARRWRAGRLVQQNQHCWPTWKAAGVQPPSWPGWPGGKRFALVLTHDVETGVGVSRCEALASLEKNRGFRSAFAFVPLRYQTPERLRRILVDEGFEIMVHGLYHDGKDFRDRQTFEKRRGPMNDFLRSWETRGFATPSMLHDLSWISELDVDYAISTYDIDPFEVQSCQFGRIFPFWVQPPGGERDGFVELPYTLPQDFTMFVLLREKSNAIWRQKLDWIADKGGMALIKTHPDYMSFDASDKQADRYPVDLYTDFLDYVRERYGNEVWLARPSEAARFWREIRVEGARNVLATQGALCPICCRARAEGYFRDYCSV
jgi:hypothetical protein